MLFLYLMTVDFSESKIEDNSDKIICESCGVDFSCGANAGKCWCFNLEVNAEKLTEIREDFKSCLCEDCLSKFSTEL